MVRFDAGAAVPSDGPGLNGGQACGRGGGGPCGRDPPQKTRVETSPQTLYTQENKDIHTHAQLTLLENISHRCIRND